jgi:TRAP-type C4-dicarboxylate transport system substrate-binding protein
VPVLIPVNAIAEAIGRGTVEDATAQPATLFDYGMYRVIEYDYFVQLGTAPLMLVINKHVYDGLPDGARQALYSHSGDRLAEKYSAVLQAHADERIARLDADKKRVVTYSEAASNWGSSLFLVQGHFEPQIRPDLIPNQRRSFLQGSKSL